jgi:FkbM family methyltransferase
MNPRRLAGKLRRRIAKLRLQGRERTFARAGTFTPIIAAEAHGTLYLVSTRDRNIGRRLFVTRDRKEFGHLARALEAIAATSGPASGMLLDVGANIGTTAIPAVREHGFDRALALEPSPESYRLLVLNVHANGLAERITTLPLAVSDAPGVVRFDMGSANSGAHRVIGAAEGGEQVIEVEATTLDLLAGTGAFDPAAVGLVWMDVEGHEGRVLAGATSLLALGVPVVAEVAPARDEQRGLHVEQAVDLLATHYTHFFDLREPWRGELRTDLHALVAEYGEGFTDVLALHA